MRFDAKCGCCGAEMEVDVPDRRGICPNCGAKYVCEWENDGIDDYPHMTFECDPEVVKKAYLLARDWI